MATTMHDSWAFRAPFWHTMAHNGPQATHLRIQSPFSAHLPFCPGQPLTRMQVHRLDGMLARCRFPAEYNSHEPGAG